MRWLIVAIVLADGVAHAGPNADSATPIAKLSDTIDDTGTASELSLDPRGVLRISQAGSATVALELGGAPSRGSLAVGSRGGRRFIVATLTDGSKREAVIVGRAGAGAWHVITRFPLGSVGLDQDYAVEIEASANGVIRYQSRGEIHRCDGKPAYLFAEGFDGEQFKRKTTVPTNVPASAPVITAKLDATHPEPPLVYQARAASFEPGAADAGALGIPYELDDGKPATFWHEELAGSAGEGQFFTFEPRMAGAKAKQLRIVPGNATSAAALRASNRPHELAVVSATGAWHVVVPDAVSDPLGSAYVAELPAAVSGCVSVVLESTYGPPQGTTAISELEIYAEGETSGGEAMLAHAIAAGDAGATTASANLARRGAAGAAAIDTELARTADAAGKRRLIAALTQIADPAAAPGLARAATSGWVRGADLVDVIAALGRFGQVTELGELAATSGLALDARIAAATHLVPSGAGLTALVELAGHGPRELRHAVIETLGGAAVSALVAAIATQSTPSTAGDLIRALTKSARAPGADRAAAMAAMLAALPAATDYERRYRLVDGIATLGDAAALATLATTLHELAAGAETSALREVAVHAIAVAPRPDAVGLVVELARDPDAGVRLEALAALASAEPDATDAKGPWHTSDGPDGIDRVIITTLASDRWPEVRRRAAVALGARCMRIGPARALGDAVATDAEFGVRRDALTALVQCSAAGVGATLVKLWDDSKTPIELREHAVNLAVALGDPKLAAILVDRFTRWRGQAITSAEALELVQSAAAAIGALHPPGAGQALLDALDDTAFPEIVSAAALGLGALGPACPAAAKSKLTMIGRTDDQNAVAAKRAAAQCGH